MKLVLDIASSAEFWRQRYPLDRTPTISSLGAPQHYAYAESEIRNLTPLWIDADFLAPLDGVLHTLAFDHAHKRRSASHITHTWSSTIPPNSFAELKDGTFVMSPGFMFLNAALILPKNKLIAFGDELCGLYSFDRREKRGFRKRKAPLTTVAKLSEYIDQSHNCRGHKAASIALKYLVNNSASPMETFDEMTMCLPYRLGGYGIPQYTMNVAVPLSARAARVAQRETCFLDMGFLDPKLDIEHHGKNDHSSPEEVMRDRARVNGLKEMGFEVIELTFPQVDDLIAYEIIIERIARLLNKRIDKSKLGSIPERLLLRSEVLDWNRSSGRIR